MDNILSMGLQVLITLIIISLIFGLIILPELKERDLCWEECYNDSEMLEYALESEHGINHVCYDKCGG